MTETISPEEKKEEGPPPSIEDMAAHDYIILLPQFKEALEPLSLRQVKRVICNLMEFPLLEKYPKYDDTRETLLFNIGCQLHDVKFVIMKAVLEMKKDEIDKLMAAPNAAEMEKPNEGIQDNVHGPESGGVQNESSAATNLGPS